jgi:alkylhydroperoxidase family enzyme
VLHVLHVLQRASTVRRSLTPVPSDPVATIDEGNRFERIVGQRPRYAAALADIEVAVWQQEAVDPLLLELCRLRIAQLLGCTVALVYRTPEAVAAGLDENLVRSLSQWPTDVRFSDQERVCLGYAEQLLLDAQGVSEEEADRVIDAIGQGGFLVLTYACGLFETLQRAWLTIDAGEW